MFFNLEDLVILDVLELNEDGFVMKILCYVNFEVFEYKREIEISNVNKSLYFLIVLRLREVKKVELFFDIFCLENEFFVFFRFDKEIKFIDDRNNGDESED